MLWSEGSQLIRFWQVLVIYCCSSYSPVQRLFSPKGNRTGSITKVQVWNNVLPAIWIIMKVKLKIAIKSINCMIYNLVNPIQVTTCCGLTWPFVHAARQRHSVMTWATGELMDSQVATRFSIYEHIWTLTVLIINKYKTINTHRTVTHQYWTMCSYSTHRWISLNINKYDQICKPGYTCIPNLPIHTCIVKGTSGTKFCSSRWRILTNDTSWEGGSCSMPLLGVWSLGDLPWWLVDGGGTWPPWLNQLATCLVVMETSGYRCDQVGYARSWCNCLVCYRLLRATTRDESNDPVQVFIDQRVDMTSLWCGCSSSGFAFAVGIQPTMQLMQVLETWTRDNNANFVVPFPGGSPWISSHCHHTAL